jgi:hypothetical protein
MELHCQECGAAIRPHARNADRQLATCQKCRAVFQYAECRAADTGAGRARSGRAAHFPVPAGITLEQRADDLRITRRWRSKAAIGLAIFAVLWDAAVVWFYWSADDLDPLLLCFTLPFLVFGVLITYLTFCLFLNHTVIEVSRGLLSVRHSPLPWPGKHVALIDVDHLCCEEHGAGEWDSAPYDYLLKAVTADGKRIKLLSAREEPEQVLFVAQVINDWLRVADRPRHSSAPQ